MKKFVVSFFLAVAFAVPVIAAEKGSIDVVGKLGAVVNSKMTFIYERNDSFLDCKIDSAVSSAAEGLYYLLPELPVGLGINYRFNSKLKSWEGYEIGVTNMYLTVKPTVKMDSKIFTAVYAIGQLGYGFNRMDGDGTETDDYKEEVGSNGLYWGLGVGTEIMNDFIFEFVFSTNYWKNKYTDYFYGDTETTNMKTTAVTFFAGYKFNI